MASAATSTPLSPCSSSALINAKAPPARTAESSVTLPAALPSVSAGPIHSHANAAPAYQRKGAHRNVVAKATEAAAPEVVTVQTPEIVKTIQEAWSKVEDKYAVSSLAVAGGVALWASFGMISAIDRLPIVPGVLELVGIGYSGWFAYKNLIFKPDREALIEKIKATYKEITGSSS